MTNDEVINNTSMVVRKSISYELSRHLFSFNTLVTLTNRFFSIHKCAFYNLQIIRNVYINQLCNDYNKYNRHYCYRN